MDPNLQVALGADLPALEEASVADNDEDEEALRLLVLRRVRGKQRPPPAFLLLGTPAGEEAPAEAVSQAAIAAEGVDELTALSPDAQRQHVHWTHVRTHNPQDRQPSSFTRPQFFEFLQQVRKEVYPEAANPTGSILLFGLVAKERHAESAKEEERAEHHHCATFCSKRHYWRKVAQHSHSVYRVKLNAVAHDGYGTMYSYLKVPSVKKPASELDAEAWMSKYHPRGDALRRLLESGAKFANARSYKRQGGKKRHRTPDLFELIKEHGFKDVLALQAHANQEAAQGNAGLAEFCTRQGHKLQGMMDQAWAVMEAPERLRQQRMTRLEKLAQAAETLPCCCGGKWPEGAVAILQNNDIDPAVFCQSIRRSLQLGACRGVNVACIGSGGCGKSTLLEPLDRIFRALPKPQRGSTFAFMDLANYEIILWQDYDHNEDTVCFTDILSIFVGESFGLRVAGTKNAKILNTAPTFYSGRGAIESKHRDPKVRQQLNEMMDEWFTTYKFDMPLPREARQADWPCCGRCAANFFLKEHPASP